ncbi:protein phosphatase 1 regulatory subunit 32 [Sphaeramia orbicularis]|uniref:protein phosphatase 1 regulatory subunit 32 n=1 Tax=Sphaeramia orbicularis TaxID=375764 RepID=UPI00117DA3C9|nr:protein phosphatase 1 regulatory subunit 32 [Sphaeramia orbicularis]
MAEQGRIVMPIVGATGNRGRLTSNTLKLHNICKMRLTPPLHPSKSGFTSNQRPVLSYRPSLDLIDNPHFGLLLSDSYMSQTKLHYRPQIHSDGSEYLAKVNNKPTVSGFHQSGTHPKAASLEEKTEHQRVFIPHPLTPTVSHQNHVTLGPKQETGFTKEKDRQFYTFLDKTSSMVEPPCTQDSVMKSHFLPPSSRQGTVVIPSVRGHSCRETGFSRSTAPLACPTSPLPSPWTKTAAPTLRTTGKKEPSGFLHNAPNNIFPVTPFGSSHFFTHYQNTFSPHVDLRQLRSSYTGAGIISAKMDNSYNRRDMDRFIFRE